MEGYSGELQGEVMEGTMEGLQKLWGALGLL